MSYSSDEQTLYHALSCEEALLSLDSQVTGLGTKEAVLRLEREGSNTIQREQARTSWQLFLSQFKDPLNIMLLIATLIGVLLGEYLDAGAMLSIVLLSAILGFVQEYRAERAVEALQKLSSPQAKVLREGETVQLDAAQLVMGDVVQLAAGDMIPADGRLLEAADLQVDEASLTGESKSVRKHTRALQEKTHLSDRGNMVFTGTSVVNGSALALITATGMRTQLGKIAERILTSEEQKTPLQVKFERIGRQIALAVVVLITLVFGATMLNKPAALTFAQHAGTMLLFSVSLAVAAVPSSLPAIVTIGLAMGTAALARKKMLIKRLPAAESLGSITQICSDKTGTLTKNEMTVTRLWTQAQEIEVTGSGYEREGAFLVEGESCDPALFSLPLRIGALCNEAQLSEKEGEISVIGDPTEGALLVAAQKALGDDAFAEDKQKKVFPFDSIRKRMSVVSASAGGTLEVYAKGAPDLLLSCCEQWVTQKGVVPLSQADRDVILAQNERLARQALRVLALAYKPLGNDVPETSEESEQGLIFVGLVGMIDPPRPEVLGAIEKARTAGIQVMVITGDHASTAQAVAEQIGLFQKGDQVLTGVDVESMDDEALSTQLDTLRIVSRALPEHKYRIVQLLQKKGHIVAMTGDGVNDAPALKRADIGLAMGITGTDVAKSVSKAIILDDNFSTIVAAIEEGRHIYDKIVKSTRYLLSCNAGEIWVVFLAVLIGLPLPLLPLQILLMNLITDGLPALALSAEPTDEGTMQRPPRPPDASPLDLQTLIFLLVFGLIMGVGSLFLYHQALPQGVEKARTIAFTALVMFEMFAVLGVRSIKPFGRINPLTNLWLLVAVLSSIALQALLIYWPPLQHVFKTVPLTAHDWGRIILVSSLGFLVMELSKLFLREARFRVAR